jgi:probable F420-dependent oxidoreductase
MPRTLSFGLFGLHRGANTDPDTLAARARLAEQAGFESVWVGDHVTLPYGAQAIPANPADQPRLEVVVALTYLAAVTSRVRLGVGVIVLPQRQPVLLAKQLTSIDVLSKGRLIVGIGVGYLEPELNALGASLADRGARTDEYLAAMRAIWDERAPSFAGQFVSFTEVMQRPLPVQRPNPPIVVGGSSTAAYRRAVTSANGFYGSTMSVEHAAEVLGQLRALSERHERPAELGELEITITPSETIDVETARRYADLGVHRLLLWPRNVGEPGALEGFIDSVGDGVIGRISC